MDSLVFLMPLPDIIVCQQSGGACRPDRMVFRQLTGSRLALAATMSDRAEANHSEVDASALTATVLEARKRRSGMAQVTSNGFLYLPWCQRYRVRG